MWLLSAGGGASGEGTATAAGTGTGAGAGVGGVTGAGAGAGVATAGAGTDAVGVGGGALAGGDCAATVDSAWTGKAERSGFRFARGAPATFVYTTGTAKGEVLNADGSDGRNIGPFAVTGQPLNCENALDPLSGATLATSFTFIGQGLLGDGVVTTFFAGQ